MYFYKGLWFRQDLYLLIPTYFPGKESTLFTITLRYGAASKLERRAAAEEPRLTRRKIPSKVRQIDPSPHRGRPDTSFKQAFRSTEATYSSHIRRPHARPRSSRRSHGGHTLVYTHREACYQGPTLSIEAADTRSSLQVHGGYVHITHRETWSTEATRLSTHQLTASAVPSFFCPHRGVTGGAAQNLVHDVRKEPNTVDDLIQRPL